MSVTPSPGDPAQRLRTTPKTAPLDSVIRLAWLNFEGGGMLPAGGYDFTRLQRLITPLHPTRSQPQSGTDLPVAILALCEAKEWAASGNARLLNATAILREQLGRPYVGKFCSRDSDPLGPALFYDPAQVEPVQWYDDNTYPGYDDKHDTVRFRVIGSGVEFLVVPRHWPALSPQQRKEAARLLGRYGDDFDQPTFVMGDLNGTASGPRWPRRDWAKASYRARDSKARRLPDGQWIDDTDAVDHLIGWWDHTLDRREGDLAGARTDGCGFWALPEIAHATGTSITDAFTPTVNRGIDAGGGQIIDHCLVNQPHLFLPGSYRIHAPQTQHDGRWDSDHRLGEATFDLTVRPGTLAFTSIDLARRYRLAE